MNGEGDAAVVQRALGKADQLPVRGLGDVAEPLRLALEGGAALTLPQLVTRSAGMP